MAMPIQAADKLYPTRMPESVAQVIEKHVEGRSGLPTKELVMAICDEPGVGRHKAEVVRYFLAESPLTANDLPELTVILGQPRMKQLTKQVEGLHALRARAGRAPRWTA